MSTGSEELEREVESTRAEVDETLDALKEKMSVGDLWHSVTRSYQDSGGPDLFDNLSRQVRDNPVPLALLGIGLAWLMSGKGQPDLAARRRDFETWYSKRFDRHPEEQDYHAFHEVEDRRSFTQRGHGVADQASSAVARAWEAATGGLRSAYDRAMGAGSSAASSVSSYGSAAGSRLGAAGETMQERYASARRGTSRAYGEAADYAERMADSLSDTYRREPLIFAALGVAAGAAIGALLPSTEAEDRWIGPSRDRLRDEAWETGREQVEKAKHVAEKTYESARQEAAEQGLIPESDRPIAEKVRDVAEKATETASEEARKQDLGKA